MQLFNAGQILNMDEKRRLALSYASGRHENEEGGNTTLRFPVEHGMTDKRFVKTDSHAPVGR